MARSAAEAPETDGVIRVGGVSEADIGCFITARITGADTYRSDGGKAMNWPNRLSLLRVGLVPLIVLMIIIGASWSYGVALALFLVGGLTDWADGWMARRYRIVTNFGKFMDPVAGQAAGVVHHDQPVRAGVDSLVGLRGGALP